jgi:hypothetical protein
MSAALRVSRHNRTSTTRTGALPPTLPLARPTPPPPRRPFLRCAPVDALKEDFRHDRLPRNGAARCRVSDEPHRHLLERGMEYVRAVEPLEAMDYVKARQYTYEDVVPYAFPTSMSAPHGVLFPVHARLSRFRWLEGERYSAVVGGFRAPLWLRDPVEVKGGAVRRGLTGDVMPLFVYRVDDDVWAALPSGDRAELERHWSRVAGVYDRARSALRFD